MMSKDREIRTLKEQLELSQQQVSDLKDFIEKSKAPPEDTSPAKRLKRMKLEVKVNSAPVSDDSDNPDAFNDKFVAMQQLQQHLDEYAQSAEVRQNNLKDMDSIISRLINKASEHKSC